MLRKLVLLSLLSVVLAACAAARTPYAAPQPAVSGGLEPYGVPVVPGGESWWNRFDDPALDALLEKALDRNLDVREALARVEESRALRGAARQAWLPGGGAVAAHDEQRLSALEAGGAPARSRMASAFASAGWEIDLFGRIRSLNQAATARLGATEALADQTRIVIAADLARTWFALGAAEERARVLMSYRDDQKEIVGILEAQVEEGFSDEADLARARAVLAEDAIALASAENEARRLRHALAVLVGEQPGSWTPPARSTARPLEFRPVAVADAATLLRGRPDVIAAERELAAATAEVGVATADLFPRLELSGVFGFLAGSAGDLGSSGTTSWRVGPSLSWGIFDLGRVRARIRAADARADAALIGWERTVLRALEDAESAFSAAAAAQTTVAAAADQLAQARLATELVTIRYEEGVSGYFELLDARRSALRAELAHVDAVAAHRAASAELLRALGTRPFA